MVQNNDSLNIRSIPRYGHVPCHGHNNNYKAGTWQFSGGNNNYKAGTWQFSGGNNNYKAGTWEFSGDNNNYKAKSGYVLIMNNYIFPKRDDVERIASNDDVRNLTSLFDDFNFRHRLENNQTGSQMINLLQTTAEKDFSGYDCFVCVILSHGGKDGIYGTDEELIKIEAITSLFRCNECPSLEGKPKIFLIQACRGSQRDRVTVESDGPAILPSWSSSPADADFLICFASAPGHESYRQVGIGSWFIAAVVDVFKEYAEREHLMDMMTRVNDRVAGFFSKEGLKQMPSQVSMLRKKVFFDPKYS